MGNENDCEQLVDTFLEHLDVIKGFSANTVQAYAGDLRDWLDFLEELPLSWQQFSEEHIQEYFFFLSGRQGAPLQKSSLARKLTALKSFYRYLVKSQQLKKNPLQNARTPKYQRKLPRPIRTIEMERFLDDNGKALPHLETRDKALWELMYSAGMRISEALSLNLNDVFDFSCTPITVFDSLKVEGKGSKQRMVFVGESAAKALLRYHQLRDNFPPQAQNNKALFLNKNGTRLTRRGAAFILQKRRRQLELTQEFTPHSLRHSFATDMLNMGADIRHVQAMLGHASVSTTQNYTYVAKERLQQVMRESHPHAKKIYKPVTKK